MSRESSVEEIRERLAAATDGPWRIEGWSQGPDVEAVKIWATTHRAGPDRDQTKEREVASAPWASGTMIDQAEANAELIAHAPTDIAYLLEIAEAARDVLASEAGEPDPQCACDYCDSRRRLRDALEAENE